MSYKLTYEFSYISDEDRIKICDRYLKYTDYENIEYWTYDYCNLYDFEISEEDTIYYDDNGEICGFLPKGWKRRIRECNKTFEEIYLELQMFEKSDKRGYQLNKLGIK